MHTLTVQNLTCPFIQNANKILAPKRSINISDRFIRISTNVIYHITCILGKTIYIGEPGRHLADSSREHLRDVEKKMTKMLQNKLHAILTSLYPFYPQHDNLRSFLTPGKHRKSQKPGKNFILRLGTLSAQGINQ